MKEMVFVFLVGAGVLSAPIFWFSRSLWWLVCTIPLGGIIGLAAAIIMFSAYLSQFEEIEDR